MFLCSQNIGPARSGSWLLVHCIWVYLGQGWAYPGSDMQKELIRCARPQTCSSVLSADSMIASHPCHSPISLLLLHRGLLPPTSSQGFAFCWTYPSWIAGEQSGCFWRISWALTVWETRYSLEGRLTYGMHRVMLLGNKLVEGDPGDGFPGVGIWG